MVCYVVVCYVAMHYLIPALGSAAVKHGQLHAASDLAERYHDFRVLVTLCQESGNTSRLKEYITNYSEQVSAAAGARVTTYIRL